MNGPILSIRDLRVYFHTAAGVARAVDGVSFDLHPGRTLALVGESGCGKSVSAMALMGVLPTPPARVEGGTAMFQGRDLLTAPPAEMQRIRGGEISMIFQEPMSAMNPVYPIGAQIGDVLRLHRGMNKIDARREAVRLFEEVGIPAPGQRVNDYPHQLSGGMLQRAMIAMALACGPKVLIADEPTTALDVTIQAQILELLRRIQQERGTAILLITHDLGVVAETAHDVAVMYAGKMVESATAEALFSGPRHPYTRGLFASLPSFAQRGQRLYTIPGTVPAATAFPEGCRFAPRCPHAFTRCRTASPALLDTGEGRDVACWLHDEAARAEAGVAPMAAWEGLR
jgi:oligopeptide/dipeptide ABC transporter ATP-binding protein